MLTASVYTAPESSKDSGAVLGCPPLARSTLTLSAGDCSASGWALAPKGVVNRPRWQVAAGSTRSVA